MPLIDGNHTSGRSFASHEASSVRCGFQITVNSYVHRGDRPTLRVEPGS